MARKPNYDFERRERERLRGEKNAARAQAKTKIEDHSAGPIHAEDQSSDAAKD